MKGRRGVFSSQCFLEGGGEKKNSQLLKGKPPSAIDSFPLNWPLNRTMRALRALLSNVFHATMHISRDQVNAWTHRYRVLFAHLHSHLHTYVKPFDRVLHLPSKRSIHFLFVLIPSYISLLHTFCKPIFYIQTMARCYANKIFLLLSKLDSIIRHDFFSFFSFFRSDEIFQRQKPGIMLYVPGISIIARSLVVFLARFFPNNVEHDTVPILEKIRVGNIFAAEKRLPAFPHSLQHISILLDRSSTPCKSWRSRNGRRTRATTPSPWRSSLSRDNRAGARLSVQERTICHW